MDCYVVHVCHTQRRDAYITLLRDGDCGYCWTLGRAARLPAADVLGHPERFADGHVVAVPCAVLDGLAVSPQPGQRNILRGPCVPNTGASWRALLASALCAPQNPAQPKYRHARRASS